MPRSSATARVRRASVPVVSACLVLAVAACTSGGTEAAAPSSAAAAPAAASPSPSADPHAGMTMTDQESGPGLGVRLASLVAQHSVLAADMMRARLRRAPDVAQAADAALSKNTQALGTLLDGVVGSASGATFSALWSDHIRYLYAYADARGSRNSAAAAKARRNLLVVDNKLGALVAKLSSGRLTVVQARTALRGTSDQLLQQADAFAAGRYPAAAAAYQGGYQHGFELGGALAGALLPAADAAQLAHPDWKLRTALTDALGDHVALVVASMRAATGAPGDFTALSTHLNANTVALASAVDSLFGAAAAHQFQDMWADHVDALMLYTGSTIKHDKAGVAKAQTRLRAFEPALAAFLAGATQSQLAADALARAYLDHDRMLVGELTAYATKKYTQAHELSYQAYDEMYSLSGQLAHAIGVTLGKKLPQGGSQTGGGGMAAVVGGR